MVCTSTDYAKKGTLTQDVIRLVGLARARLLHMHEVVDGRHLEIRRGGHASVGRGEVDVIFVQGRGQDLIDNAFIVRIGRCRSAR